MKNRLLDKSRPFRIGAAFSRFQRWKSDEKIKPMVVHEIPLRSRCELAEWWLLGGGEKMMDNGREGR